MKTFGYRIKNKFLGLYRKINKVTPNDMRYFKYSFSDAKSCNSFEQFEALITKTYHSIEKGLSYQTVRLGFGKGVIDELLLLLQKYGESGFPKNAHCYATAIDNLKKYAAYHVKNGIDVSQLEKDIEKLAGMPNSKGGTLTIRKDALLNSQQMDFASFSKSRHSVRDFSNKPVDDALVIKAIELAQATPSACNRQGWKAHLIVTKEKVHSVLINQNGNKGFCEKIDKLLVITSDFRYFNRQREHYQAYIDGGMYAMNLLYCLHYEGIATVPLSAALTELQDKDVRRVLELDEAETLILFIGLGNYCDEYKIPRSERHEARYTIK